MKPIPSIDELVKDLPEEDQMRVREYVESLVNRRVKRKGQPTFDWAGALIDLRDQYTSVELQHEISRLRAEEE